MDSSDAQEADPKPRAERLIYVVDDDPLHAQLLEMQISHFGYTVRPFTDLERFKNAIHDEMPAALLMDVVFPQGNLAGIQAIQELRRSLPEMPPVVFLSASIDLPSRLQAVRAGGEAYFTKPIAVTQIIDALDRILLTGKPEPYHILIVDDAPVQAEASRQLLDAAGMVVEVVTDPADLLRALEDFTPELILLNMWLSGCTGMELARIIRQTEAFISIPIVYLAPAKNSRDPIQAAQLGGDDFLIRPAPAEQLIAAVASRAERYRQLRKLMYTDGLTGLLNHATLKERLKKEIKRAARQDAPVSFGMLDLDHFKLVNDTYGHGAGDRVLRSLAQVLTRRLRLSDVVGRYGGEEFAIIFPDTPPGGALTVLEEIRQSFGEVQHQAGEATFSVTFSGGVASFPAYHSPDEIRNAADRALYTAKGLGRNRIIQV
jgi:diguanylate cyclase (GGDEF)-like protein